MLYSHSRYSSRVQFSSCQNPKDYLIISMHLHKLFLAQRTHKQFQMEKETRTIPTFKAMKKHSKSNRKHHQIFTVHRDQINFQLKQTPCSTYCLHPTTRKGPVCPVYRQTLRDGRTGFEWAFQHYLFTHITSHLRTGFNIQRKSTTDTWWKKPKRQGFWLFVRHGRDNAPDILLRVQYKDGSPAVTTIAIMKFKEK